MGTAGAACVGGGAGVGAGDLHLDESRDVLVAVQIGDLAEQAVGTDLLGRDPGDLRGPLRIPVVLELAAVRLPGVDQIRLGPHHDQRDPQLLAGPDPRGGGHHLADQRHHGHRVEAVVVQGAVAVVVHPVTQLRGVGEHTRIGVVAVPEGLADAVAVVVQIDGLLVQLTVTVVVAVVGLFHRRGVDGRIAVITVAVGLRRAVAVVVGQLGVLVGVAVAVVVDAVGLLEGAWVDVRVPLVAVPLGKVVAIAVAVVVGERRVDGRHEAHAAGGGELVVTTQRHAVDAGVVDKLQVADVIVVDVDRQGQQLQFRVRGLLLDGAHQRRVQGAVQAGVRLLHVEHLGLGDQLLVRVVDLGLVGRQQAHVGWGVLGAAGGVARELDRVLVVRRSLDGDHQRTEGVLAPVGGEGHGDQTALAGRDLVGRPLVQLEEARRTLDRHVADLDRDVAQVGHLDVGRGRLPRGDEAEVDDARTHRGRGRRHGGPAREHDKSERLVRIVAGQGDVGVRVLALSRCVGDRQLPMLPGGIVVQSASTV